MNRYFSRLAERSGVTVNANKAGAGSSFTRTSTEWGEQAIEIAAPSNASASTAGNEGVESANQATATNSLGQTTASLELPNFISQSFASAQNIRKNDANFTTPESSPTPGSISTDSHFFEHDQSIEKASAETLLSDDPVLTQAFFSENKKINSALSGNYRSHSETRESRSDGAAAHRRASSAATPEVSVQTTASGESTHDQANVRLTNWETHDSATTQVARAKAMSMNTAAGPALAGERVLSTPLQTTNLPVQSPRPGPRTSIEVNIGKIELEVFAPVTKSAAPIAPAPSSTPRQKPATAFNPHRHYLRGR